MTKHAADARGEASAFLRHVPTGALLEALPVGVYSCDSDGRIVQFNRRACDIWGRSPRLGDDDERFCGSYRLYRTDGSALPHDQTPMAQALKNRRPFRNLNVVIERPDGSRVTALVNIDPVFDEDGAFRGAVNCFQDVTDVERAHARAEQKERELEATLSGLPAAIYRTDAQGRVTFYNEAAVALAGRRPEIGTDQWCISWRLHTSDGKALPLDECPMAMAIREERPIAGAEILVEQPDGTRVPCLAYPTPLFDEHGALAGAVNMLISIAEQKQAENNQRLLINELNHRVKNTLAMVQAIASQTLRRARSPADFVASLGGRIQAFARAHNMLVQGPGGVDLADLVRSQVLLESSGPNRVVHSGPTVHMEAQAALHLALVLYELGTNARKYGALCVPEGRVVIEWSVAREDGERVLDLHWREEGGPTVAKPRSAGFGTTLIEKTLRSHGGEVTLTHAAGGLECALRMPLQRPQPTPVDALAGGVACAGESGPHARLKGLRILIAEDEPLVALDMENVLEELGCAVVGPAATVKEALQLAGDNEVDAALLDANLLGTPVDEVAAALTRNGVPFAFITGYGREGLPASFQHAPLVAKPFSAEEIAACLEELNPAPAVVPLRRRAGELARRT